MGRATSLKDPPKQGKIYNTKIIESGDRLEIYKYQGYINIGGESNNQEGRRGKAEIEEEQKEDNKIRRRKETLTKARNDIIRLISCNKDLNVFMTLTYKENYQDLKKSKAHLRLFFKKLRQDHEALKYIYVLEFQERGAIHYHILTNIKVDIETAGPKERKKKLQKDLENNYCRKYWSNRGFIDIRKLDQEGIRNVSKYVAAYLVKDLLEIDLKGNRVYGYSNNLNKPIITTIESKASIEELIDIEGYKLAYTSDYKRYYKDKSGHDVESKVNYYDYLRSGENENK